MKAAGSLDDWLEGSRRRATGTCEPRPVPEVSPAVPYTAVTTPTLGATRLARVDLALHLRQLRLGLVQVRLRLGL